MSASSPNCSPCALGGKLVVAHYMVGKRNVPMCPRHMREWEAQDRPQSFDVREFAEPKKPAPAEEKPPMPEPAAATPPKANSHSRVRREIDMDAFRADLASGLSIQQLAARYDVSESTVSLRKRELAGKPPYGVKANTASAITKPNGAKPKPKKVVSVPDEPAAVPRSLTYRDVLADLRARRDKLDAAISAVEALDTAL